MKHHRIREIKVKMMINLKVKRKMVVIMELIYKIILLEEQEISKVISLRK